MQNLNEFMKKQNQNEEHSENNQPLKIPMSWKSKRVISTGGDERKIKKHGNFIKYMIPDWSVGENAIKILLGNLLEFYGLSNSPYNRKMY